MKQLNLRHGRFHNATELFGVTHRSNRGKRTDRDGRVGCMEPVRCSQQGGSARDYVVHQKECARWWEFGLHRHGPEMSLCPRAFGGLAGRGLRNGLLPSQSAGNT
jgi:hypothetical protein